MALHAILLAAGEGKRMGGSKALLALEGQTLLARHLCRLHAFGCASIVAVVRPVDAGAARAIANGLALPVTIAAAITPSQAASLVVATAHAAFAPRDVVVITPVDLLPPDLGTFAALLGELAGDCMAASPRFGDRGGHPVLVRGEVLSPYTRRSAVGDLGGEPPPLRDVLAGLGARRIRVDVDDPTVVGDFDVPADLARASAIRSRQSRRDHRKGGR